MGFGSSASFNKKRGFNKKSGFAQALPFNKNGPILLFEDTFDGSTLDTNKWQILYPWGGDHNAGTGELQTFVSSANTLSGGILSITATKNIGSHTDEGPKTGSSASDLGFGDSGGTTAWTNPTNAQSSNDSYATIVRSTTGASNYLQVTGFNFSSIPDGNTILGYKIEFEAKSTAASTYAIGSSILVLNGNPSGSSFTNADLVVPTTEAFISAGGTTTTNGATLTPAQVKNSNFGVAFTVAKTAGSTSQTCSIDSVRVTVYTAPVTYNSGMISSYGSFNRTYGYFECECKTPAGSGFWPAFWLLVTNQLWPPEVDIAEFGGNETSHYYTNSIYGDGSTGDDGYINVNPTDGFHIYGLDWQRDYLKFYCDGVLVRTVTNPDAIPHENMYIIFDFAIAGGGWSLPGGVSDSTVFPSACQLKRISVWDVKP